MKKMKNKSTHAEAAQLIRKELKKEFPSIKFSVCSDSYSGGNSVRISWKDGPITDNVSKITRKYQYGHFDGMCDCYEYSNVNDNFPQVKYVFNNREVSESIKDECFEQLKKTLYGWENIIDRNETNLELKKHWGFWTATEYMFRIFIKMDLTNGFNKEMIYD